MNRPSDEAIAAAFWEMFTEADINCEWWRVKPDIVNRAFEIDAEAAGPALPNEEVMQIEAVQHGHPHDPVARGEDGKASPQRCNVCGGGPVWCNSCRDWNGPMRINPQKVTTSPERVQIPAESTHVRCPRCPALMPPGLSCKGNPPDDPCPMRK